MSMDGNTLGTAIANSIMNAAAPDDVRAQIIELWQKIGVEIVNHIKNNGTVKSGISVQVNTGSGTGSTTGPGQIE